jgi:hypothetical protein
LCENFHLSELRLQKARLQLTNGKKAIEKQNKIF